MSLLSACAGLVFAATAAAGTPTARPAISGDYLEARSCDVYIGPCFANAEIGLVGELAIMAWSVRQGSFDGVDLSGLSVVAVVRADGTLGDLALTPVKAKAALVVDERASAVQRAALAALAKELGGSLLSEVTRVEAAPVSFTAGACEKSGCAKLTAGADGRLVRLETRCLHADDHKCGNQMLYYPPLSRVTDATPAMALTQEFHGRGLDATWKLINKTSGFTAKFSR
jgi:hypothetical protein